MISTHQALGQLENLRQSSTLIEYYEPHTIIRRHRHAGAYAAVALQGEYCETGNSGRFELRPGLALIHGAFDAHFDLFKHKQSGVLNIALPTLSIWQRTRLVKIDPDTIFKAAQREPEAAQFLLAVSPEAICPPRDWHETLAQALLLDQKFQLRDWAEANGLRPETISRGFANVFGVTPCKFRAEARAKRALDAILFLKESLVQIAADCSFSDQAHMTRALVEMTGLTPLQLRKNALKMRLN